MILWAWDPVQNLYWAYFQLKRGNCSLDPIFSICTRKRYLMKQIKAMETNIKENCVAPNKVDALRSGSKGPNSSEREISNLTRKR
ncbi:unnamed protein product [Sphenostylis stenocarpa]|uniref:Uncharacterized protein n=1 Tax=Sphenostylis stenocarpa TaxID=92480 RepID=A0AA86SPX7_9FABA|nr:unnamed protein product [Sphenostylis stenocarpa]